MPAADTRPTLRPRRWLGLLFWTSAIVFLSILWSRSYHTADVGAVYTRAGNVNGILSHRGQLLVAMSTLSLGPDKSLTADHIAAPVTDGDWLYDGTYTNASTRKGQWGFGYSLSKPGDLRVPDATFSALVFPHWAAIAVCSVVLLWHIRRFTLRTRERRWRKQGRCVACGYDLQGAPSDRCPECGTPTAAGPTTLGGSIAGDVQATARQAANVVATLLLIAATIWATRLYFPPPSDAEVIAAEEEAAGLNRVVKYVKFEGANADKALETLRIAAELNSDSRTMMSYRQLQQHRVSWSRAHDSLPMLLESGSLTGAFWNAPVRTIIAAAGDAAPAGMPTFTTAGSIQRNPVMRLHSIVGLEGAERSGVATTQMPQAVTFWDDVSLQLKLHAISEPASQPIDYALFGRHAILITPREDQEAARRFIFAMRRTVLTGR